MYCPLCGAEYRPGFAVCSDCQVALVPDPPRGPSPSIDDPSADGTSFVPLWSGSDPRKHAEVCEALDRQKIPARTLRREDRLFNRTIHPDFEVYVPVSLLSAAREALHQADPIEDDSEQRSDSERLLDSGILEIPAEEGAPNDDENDDEERGDALNFDPQDATVEIWSGQDVAMAAMVASSLRENHIPYRPDPDISDPDSAEPPDIAEKDASDEMRPTRLLVFPEDRERARAIVRQIVDAIPPE